MEDGGQLAEPLTRLDGPDHVPLELDDRGALGQEQDLVVRGLTLDQDGGVLGDLPGGLGDGHVGYNLSGR